MPFERWDGREERSRTRAGRRWQLVRKMRVPIFAVVGLLAAVTLFEQSYLTRNIGHSFAPKTNLGWQSFLPAYSMRESSAGTSTASGDELDSTFDSNSTSSDGDFWDDLDSGFDDNDAYEGFQTDQVSELWDPFVPNSAPLVEVTAKSCMWPPSVYDACMPDSTMREDAEKGKWIRVEKDMNLRVGVYYNYLFYRRLPRNARDTSTVREFRLLTDNEAKQTTLSQTDGWQKISQSLRAGIWPSQESIFLWYRTAPRGNASDEITEIDIVWGSSGTLYGWDRMNRDFAEPKEKSKLKDTDEGAELMWRKGNPRAPKAELPLAFSNNGTYKIMQIADLHFSVGKGKCRDSNWPGCNDPMGSDLVTLQWLAEVLDDEKPDMVVLSGDQLNGQDTSFSAESVILKVAKLFEKRKIPWTAVLGNHDSEKTTLTRYGQLVMMQALPYFVGEPGPIEVDGEGNYVIKLVSADESRTHLFTLYFLDSHGYAASLNPWTTEYDYIKKSQVDWFKTESRAVKMLQRPFSPPVLENSTFGISNDVDSDGLRRSRPSSKARLEGRQSAIPALAKPNAMAIFHIPLPEVYDLPPDMDSKSGSPLIFGNLEDGRGAATKDEGHFFDNAIMAQTELGSRENEIDSKEVEDDPDYAAAVLNARPEVKVILNGHCHVSDECRRIMGVWSCFAGGSSYSGYSQVGFDRRVRVLQLEDYGETIKTYKIVDGHADTSGKSESSESKAGSGDNRDPEAGAMAAYQEAIEEELEELNAGTAGQPSVMGKTRRQQPSLRKKIDEMVLVGKVAPA